MNFRQLIAQYISGNLSADELPRIAYIGMTEGLDSPSLYILAGLEKNEHFYVADRYFRLALEELRIVVPDKRIAAIEYANAIAEEIIGGKKDVFIGIGEIKGKALGNYDFDPEIKNLVYDSIFFEKVNGLYYEYDDMEASFVKGVSDEDEMLEVKKELLERLVTWHEWAKAYLTELVPKPTSQ